MAYFLRRIILSFAARLALPYFSTLSLKRHNLREGKMLLDLICVF